MEKEQKSPVEQASDASGKDEKKDFVAYESFQKAVSEKKNAQEKLSKYEQELQQLREEKLQREGKNEELIQTYKQRYEETNKRLEETNKKYAWSTLTGSIEREAIKHGCTDPKKLIRLMDDDDLRSIDVGENFKINGDSLERLIEKSKKDNHFLFKTTPPLAANGNPTTKIEKKDKPLKDMSG